MWWLGLCGIAMAQDVSGVLEGELSRAMEAWQDTAHVPHHVAVVVEDVEAARVAARSGALDVRQTDRGRFLDVDLRLGTPLVDSTHPLRGFSSFDGDSRTSVRVPFEGARIDDALRHALWLELDHRWRDARERIVLIEADRRVRVEEEDPAPDFEPRRPVVDVLPTPPLRVDLDAWERTLIDVSAVLDSSEQVVSNRAMLDARRRTWTYVDTEGTRLEHGRLSVRVTLSVEVVADDGDRVEVFRALDVHDPARLPDRASWLTVAAEVVREAEALRAAPRVGPYRGPVWLSGKAAAVFVHEVIGHRVEGHRNKDDEEGKTFLEYVGRPVLPAFLDVVDDPTLASLAGQDLNGHYHYDDEGVAAQRASLVQEGVFQGFLMGRSPLAGFAHSNGHGRRSSGHAPTSRMGNTILSTRVGLTDAAMRARMVALLREQGLDFGYLVEEIDGGFTMTGRVVPNAFNVRASRTRRVFADGRPDELVRGIDLVGTPLVAFGSIVAAGDTPEVFNGTCGAESGWVPVSGVAPALLFERLEFQLKEKGSDRPPLLSKPGEDGVAVTP